MASANIRLTIEATTLYLIRDLFLVSLAISPNVEDAHQTVNGLRANRNLPPVSLEAVQSLELETAGFMGGEFRREYAARLAELATLKPQS